MATPERCELHELEGCAECSGAARKHDASLAEPALWRPAAEAGELLRTGQPARGNARDVRCSVCGALPGYACKAYRWKPYLPEPARLATYHQERWDKWREEQR